MSEAIRAADDDLLLPLVFTALTDALETTTYQVYEQLCTRICPDLSRRIDELKTDGFSRDKLLFSCAFVGEISRLPLDFKIDLLEGFATKVAFVLRRMKALNSATPLPWRHSVAISEDLEAALAQKVEAYRELERVFSARKLPRRDTILRVACIWPILYLKAKTGQPHHKLVGELLKLVGVEQETGDPKDEAQLSKWVGRAEEENKTTIEWMEQRLESLLPYRLITAKK